MRNSIIETINAVRLLMKANANMELINNVLISDGFSKEKAATIIRWASMGDNNAIIQG